jgi:hypothetical protein
MRVKKKRALLRFALGLADDSLAAAAKSQRPGRDSFAPAADLPVKPFNNLTQEGIVLPFKNLTMKTRDTGS